MVRSPCLKILEIPGGRGGHQRPSGTEIPGGWGVQMKESSVVGVWIFSGTTHSEISNLFGQIWSEFGQQVSVKKGNTVTNLKITPGFKHCKHLKSEYWKYTKLCE